MRSCGQTSSVSEAISASPDHGRVMDLVRRVDGGELSVHGDGKHLRDQMGPEQVRDGLVVLEVGRADPDLGQEPVIVGVGG